MVYFLIIHVSYSNHPYDPTHFVGESFSFDYLLIVYVDVLIRSENKKKN